MPGPVSDSYDPEFGTRTNAGDVRDAIQGVIDEIDARLGPELKNIVHVAQNDEHGLLTNQIRFYEREMRLIRFSLLRALVALRAASLQGDTGMMAGGGFDVGTRVRIAGGGLGAGRRGRVVGSEVLVGQWWCPVLWDDAEDPELHKAGCLEMAGPTAPGDCGGGVRGVTEPEEKLLARLYADAPVAIAKLCDEELDRSGALLGRVRSIAAPRADGDAA